MKTQTYRSPKTTKSIALLLFGIGLILIGIASLMLIPGLEKTTTGDISPATAEAPSAIPAQVDFPAPELRLSDVSGRSLSLTDFAGQVVLVNNWAIWCPPCKRELPDLEQFYQKHKDQNFIIIGIEAGSPEEGVKQFLNETELTFPIWLDPDEKALDAFRTMDLPSSYVIDGTGQVRLAWVGAVRYDILEKYVAPMLAE